MKLITVISAGVLSLALVAACPAFAQEQHEEEKSKPSGQEEKRAQPEKPAKQAQPEKSAKQAQPEKSAKQAQPATKQEKPSAQRENNAKPAEKNARQENSNAKPAEKNARQDNNNSKPANKNVQQQQQHASAGHNGVSRIPQDRYQSNFGREHTFRVSQGDYQNHRFQYGGYWFGFSDPWPSNWLYTQDVFVIEIDGVYYLCNASYPGVNVALSFTS
jgi:outer membrane biosynthesis protein TonB